MFGEDQPNKPKSIRLSDHEATERFGTEVAKTVLQAGPSREAMIIALSGNLGSGKTTFVKGFCRECGVGENIQSPTFVLAKYYIVKGKTFDRLVHIDAYRLEKQEEMKALGWDDITHNPKTIILLEWPEKVSPVTPFPAITITFSVDGESRIARFE